MTSTYSRWIRGSYLCSRLEHLRTPRYSPGRNIGGGDEVSGMSYTKPSLNFRYANDCNRESRKAENVSSLICYLAGLHWRWYLHLSYLRLFNTPLQITSESGGFFSHFPLSKISAVGVRPSGEVLYSARLVHKNLVRISETTSIIPPYQNKRIASHDSSPQRKPYPPSTFRLYRQPKRQECRRTAFNNLTHYTPSPRIGG